MTFDAIAQAEKVLHATLVFERDIAVSVERVFIAFSDAKKRSDWGAPSDTAALIYDQENFCEGGEDRFRCGAKSNPNIHGTTHYLEIVPNRRIVSSETIAVDGRRLCASIATLEFERVGNVTHLKSTVQLASFIGQDMIKGHEQGHNSSLNNLVSYFSRQSSHD